MIDTKMLRNGMIYQYLGMKCRYLTNLGTGECIIQLLINGKVITVEMHEVKALKLKDLVV